MSAKRKRIPGGRWPGVLLVAAAALAWWFVDKPVAGPPAGDGTALIEAAYRDQRSGLWVETGGQVRNTLTDDNEGSRHQRFILELSTGRTLLVAHNIDLAPRVPLQRDDHLLLRGMYEWNERGGVLHWTHHDPDGRGPGGWIELHGERYR